MADRQGERVRRVVGTRDGLELQKPPDHVHHLPLFGKAVADDRLLDLHGRVLKERYPALRRGAEDDAARVCDGDAGGDVVGEKQLLDRDGLRPELRDQLLHIALELHEPRGERKPCRRGDRAVLQHLRFPGLRLDQAEADDGKPRVDAEYPHGAPLPRRGAMHGGVQRSAICAVGYIISNRRSKRKPLRRGGKKTSADRAAEAFVHGAYLVTALWKTFLPLRMITPSPENFSCGMLSSMLSTFFSSTTMPPC